MQLKLLARCVFLLMAVCRPTVGQLLANCRPTVGQQLAICRPTDGQQSVEVSCSSLLPGNFLSYCYMQAASIFLTDRSKRNHKMHTDRSVSSHLNFSKNYVTSLDFKRKILCFSHSKWLY